MKQSRRIFAILMAGVICLSLVACGGSAASDFKASTEAIVAPQAPGAPAPVRPSEPVAGGAIFDGDYNYSSDIKDTAAGNPSGGSVYQSSDVKLIRRASLNIQTTEFDQAVEQLQVLVNSVNGYFQSSELYSGSYNNKNANRSSYFVIRVPAAQYDAFLNQADGVGHVTRKTESSEDVGEVYYDLEARLKTQRTKQERLMELLKKADNMEDIIKLESALSDVEYQIEQYSSSLKRYDGLIGYATFNLNLEEVYKIVDEPTQKESLFTRMSAGVVSSFDDLVEGVQDFLIWISYNVFALVINVAVLVVVVVLVHKRVKKGFGLNRKKKQNSQDDNQNQN